MGRFMDIVWSDLIITNAKGSLLFFLFSFSFLFLSTLKNRFDAGAFKSEELIFAVQMVSPIVEREEFPPIIKLDSFEWHAQRFFPKKNG